MAKLVVLISVVAYVSAIGGINSGLNPRINGEATAVQEIIDIPYHVALSVYPTTTRETYCEGSLISPKFVLTAAICFNTVRTPRYVVIVYFGAVNITDTKIARKATKVHTHLGWDPDTLENDIAIVEFAPVRLTDQIQTIRLPPLSQGNSDFAGTRAILSGRGQTTNDANSKGVLRSAVTTVISRSICEEQQQGTVSSSSICTTETPGICLGDEGASLAMTESDNIRTLIGVASYKDVNCETARPSVFTKVSSYLAWINGVTSIPIRK